MGDFNVKIGENTEEDADAMEISDPGEERICERKATILLNLGRAKNRIDFL